MTIKTAIIGGVTLLTVIFLMPTVQYLGLMFLVKLATTLGLL